MGTGTSTTVFELAAAFNAVVDTPVVINNGPPRPGDLAGAYTLADRAGKILDWYPRWSIEDGIRHSLEWAEKRDHIRGASYVCLQP
ncbi:hypothetical protein GCM10010211_85020 [Streptomyces albospinus]|uniref:UDP-glucose 4-epimerase n=1 Tax=Streptomyces albospinus TaxID=285515 RepID=A0ABQ2VRP8_9ACTN|nr:hypothetical protein [Streptomyces albospinus]GGV04916.1 hypothetical protein GCM10010211_85020 [Streptomyces albospinus]